MTAKEVSGWIKCTLLILILLLWILSATILIETTVLRDDLSQVVLVTEGTKVGDFYVNIFFPIIFPVLITVSCFVYVIGSIGWCGAFTESQLLLGWFFFSVLVSFSVEMSAGIWRVVKREKKFDSSDLQQLKYNIRYYCNDQTSNLWFKEAWKAVHTKFQCCGVESYTDWLDADLRVLRSCCAPDITNSECAFSLQLMPGCGKTLLNHLSASNEMAALPYLMGATGIIQVLLLILAMKLWLSFCLGTDPTKAETTTASTNTYEVKRPLLPTRNPEGYYVVHTYGGKQPMKIIPVKQSQKPHENGSSSATTEPKTISNQSQSTSQFEFKRTKQPTAVQCTSCPCTSLSEKRGEIVNNVRFSSASRSSCFTKCDVCDVTNTVDVVHRLSTSMAEHRTRGVGASNEEDTLIDSGQTDAASSCFTPELSVSLHPSEGQGTRSTRR